MPPNIGLQPTPTAFARPSLRLLARLRRSVGCQRREGKNSKDDLFMQEEMPA